MKPSRIMSSGSIRSMRGEEAGVALCGRRGIVVFACIVWSVMVECLGPVRVMRREGSGGWLWGGGGVPGFVCPRGCLSFGGWWRRNSGGTSVGLGIDFVR